MSMLLRGASAAAALNEKTAQLVSGLREKGVVPTLAIVRLGAREDDLSYERAAVKRCAAVGIDTEHYRQQVKINIYRYETIR